MKRLEIFLLLASPARGLRYPQRRNEGLPRLLCVVRFHKMAPVLRTWGEFRGFSSSKRNGKQTWKSSNRQNGLRTTLERLSCHKDFKVIQAQTKVSFFYLNPVLQDEFRAIFEPFSYILLNGSKRNAILSRM